MKAIGILLLMLTGCAWKQRCAEYRTVGSIGGCSGTCSVKFTDGTRGYVNAPMVGDRVCVSWNNTYWMWQTPEEVK